MGDFEEISFPILSFKEKDSHIYGIKQRDFGLVTKGQENSMTGYLSLIQTADHFRLCHGVLLDEPGY